MFLLEAKNDIVIESPWVTCDIYAKRNKVLYDYENAIREHPNCSWRIIEQETGEIIEFTCSKITFCN